MVDHPGHGDRYERCEAENSGAGEVFLISNSAQTRSDRGPVGGEFAVKLRLGSGTVSSAKNAVRMDDQQQLDAARERPAVHDRAVANPR